MIDQLRQDFSFASRTLLKRPLVLVIPVLSLAIGIGANTAIFSAVNRLMLRAPEGVPNAHRIVELGLGRDGKGFGSFSYPDFVDLRQAAAPLQELAGVDMKMLTLSRGEAGERVFGLLVSANYFSVLGVRPARGRAFLPEEDEGPNEHAVVVLGHSLWSSRLGADPAIIGSTVSINRQPYTVIGVMPEGFRGHMNLGDVDLYVPMMQYPALSEGWSPFDDRGSTWFQPIGLLEPGTSLGEAQAAVSTTMARLADEYPETNEHRTAELRPFGAIPSEVRGPVGLFLTTLLAFAGLILLITCANVAGVFLARASARSREISIRLALGSSRARLIRHFLAESLIVFGIGGIAGLILAVWALSALSAIDIPAPYPVAFDLSLDGRVVAFAVLLTLVSGLVFGLLPARQAVAVDLLPGLKDEGVGPGSSGRRLRRGFVSAQIGASLVLLVAAGLMLRALQHAGQIERGFRAEGAYMSFLDLSTEGLDRDRVDVFQTELLQYLGSQPWVDDATLAVDLPLDMGSRSTSIRPDAWQGPDGGEWLQVGVNQVSPGYFSTLEIALREGRGFDDQDRRDAEPVAVVSRTFADQVWPGESPVGRRLRWGLDDTWVTIVGIVDDVHNQMLTDVPRPFVYRPLAQLRSSDTHLVVRTPLPEGQAGRAIHGGLRTLDPQLSLAPVIGLERYTAVGIMPQRIAGILSTTLGLLALLLSGLGVYSVMAFTVNRRTREIGIRAALGADPGRILGLVLRRAARLALPGVVLGAVLAVAVGMLLRTLLLGISPVDPVALAAVSVVVATMVVLGTLVPARRAARVDPAEALRHD